MQNDTKFITIGPAVLKIFNFEDQDGGNFTRKKQLENRKCCFLERLYKQRNNRLCDVRNDKCKIQQKTVLDISVCRPDKNKKFMTE